MKKVLTLLSLIMLTKMALAEPITITPVKTISTCKKAFQLGNTYDFKDVNTGDIYRGTVTFYRENGMMGQEAQIELDKFVDKNNKYIPGKITIIPDNHKKLQEFMNYSPVFFAEYIRGSEIILKPQTHNFTINNTNEPDNLIIIPILPNQTISTCYDELEFGDIIEFVTTQDVYKKDKLYIAKNTPIYGIIDEINANGWGADHATITFKEFKTKNIHQEKITINTDLTINGYHILKYKSNKLAQFFNYLSALERGKEVDIKLNDTNIKFVLISKE